ncbi:unnamed protein product [Arabis nemorensis]|uniref:RRM domain-containing protein n=1 Tax=Arabis nemorensis TaxID=586526 RepID=A0A565B187_9BRAS|nr:unnamed protein product [Arabis nemorensis]
MIHLHGKPIRINKVSQDKKSLDVGANFFIGNLDPNVDEKLLYDTSSAFGVIAANSKIPKLGTHEVSVSSCTTLLRHVMLLLSFDSYRSTSKKLPPPLRPRGGASSSSPSDRAMSEPLEDKESTVVAPLSDGDEVETSDGEEKEEKDDDFFHPKKKTEENSQTSRQSFCSKTTLRFRFSIRY